MNNHAWRGVENILKDEMEHYLSDIEKFLTPSEEEQTLLILKGECPHNKGWEYTGHGHNDIAYQCRLCNALKFY